MLRINNLNYDFGVKFRLKNISLCILEGEIIGFLGLTYSGKDILISLLSGKIKLDNTNIKVYIDGEKYSIDNLRKKIYYIGKDNYRITNWNIAEYIYLLDTKQELIFSSEQKMIYEANNLFQKFEIDMDVTKKINDLTEFEKRQMDILKAYSTGAKIIIIEDDFDGMDFNEIKRLQIIIKKVIAGTMAVIVNSNSYAVVSILSDKYAIFSDGMIIKKCSKEYIKDISQLEYYLIGDNKNSYKNTFTNYGAKITKDREVIYTVKDLMLSSGKKLSFKLAKGEVVTILVLNKDEKESVFSKLSGREKESDIRYIVNKNKIKVKENYSCKREKIVSIRELGNEKEVFKRMSVAENLILPSLAKISTTDYIFNGRKLVKVMLDKFSTSSKNSDKTLDDMEINDIISITLERWLIYSPSVLVLYEPFALCDVKGVAIVKSYIKKFVEKGVSILIINTRDENVNELSDRIIKLD